jgi:hypothetical protein
LQIHAQLADGRDGVYQFKNLLCRCTCCKESEEHECELPGYADQTWRIKEIRHAPASSGPRRSARGEASNAASGTNDLLDTTDAPVEMHPSSWRELTEDLEGNENVAIAYYYSDDLDYYIVKIADDPWHVVPKGKVRDDDADKRKRLVLTRHIVATVSVVDFAMSGPVRQRRRVPRVY